MRWREFCEDKIVDLREDLSFMDLYLILFVYAKKKKEQKTKNKKNQTLSGDFLVPFENLTHFFLHIILICF